MESFEGSSSRRKLDLKNFMKTFSEYTTNFQMENVKDDVLVNVLSYQS